jgi:glycosyltransferase involved in cell wall biosynthesis
MKYRLAIVTSHVIQYQDPMFRRLAEHPSIDLTVLFCSAIGAERYLDWDLGVELQWDLEMLQGYRHRFLRNIAVSKGGGFWTRVNPGIVPAITRERFDAVLVMGWGSITSWLTFATCRALSIPFFVHGDNSFVHDPPTIKGRLRSFALRALFARTAGFLLMGTMNGDFYRHFGADPSRFFLMPYAIDNDRFCNGSRLRPEERSALRAEFGVWDDRVVLLFSGKLMARKRPLHLIQAYERMAHRDRVAVVFMGDGAERAMLESYVKSRRLEGVHFLGFVNQTRMPQVYGASDVLVLPSTYDPRGTVVNEAMACGLPIVISNMVGVWGDGDIVREGENGFVVPVGDIDRLAGVLDALASDSDLRARMGARSLEIIGTWNYDRDVEGVLAALRATVPRPAGSELVPSHQAG